MSYPAIVIPSYVYGSANLGGNVRENSALLNTQVTANGTIAGYQAPGSTALDSATTSMNFDDNNTGESNAAFIEIHTVTDNADGNFNGANAIAYTTSTPNSAPPGQNFIPVRIVASNGSANGQTASVSLVAKYSNTNQSATTGTNSYAVEYIVGGVTHTMLNASDTQMPPPPPDGSGPINNIQTANFTATVGQTFDIFLFLESATGVGAPAAMVRLDISVKDTGSGGGGGAPTAVNHSYSVDSGQTLQVAAPGLLIGDSDPNLLTFQVNSYGTPSHGTVTVNTNGALTYVPNAGFSGSDSFAYVIEDSAGETGAGTVTITVNPAESAATHWTISLPPPLNVAAGSPFGFTVAADDNDGSLVSTFNGGPATVLLSTSNSPSPNGNVLGVATVQNGQATFSGLSVSAPGTYTLWILGGGLNATSLGGFVISLPNSPALHWAISEYPPLIATAGSPFALQVQAEDSNGNWASSLNGGQATVLLSKSNAASPNGVGLGVATIQDGLATFSGLTVSTPGFYTLWVTGGGSSATSISNFFVTPLIVPKIPPIVSTAQPLHRTFITGRGRHSKKTTVLTGFELTFNESLNPGSALDGANYQLFQSVKRGRKVSHEPVRFFLSYDDSSHTVSVNFFGKPAFSRGGGLVLNPSGITDPAGDTLVGSSTFTILASGRGIVA